MPQLCCSEGSRPCGALPQTEHLAISGDKWLLDGGGTSKMSSSAYRRVLVYSSVCKVGVLLFELPRERQPAEKTWQRVINQLVNPSTISLCNDVLFCFHIGARFTKF